MTPEENSKETKEQLQELYSCYSRLFNTPDGAVVLGDLNTRFFTNIVGPNQDHSYHVAQKDLMGFILANIQRGVK